jgi:V-type H+-transporting ATPase subunit a
MGSWWRSEEMEYVSLIVSEDAAHACIRELGQLGCIQFTDLNPELTPFQRRYVAYIKRCDEIERKIRYVHAEVKKLGVPVQSAGEIDSFVQRSGGTDLASGSHLLEQLESKLEKYETQLLDLNRFSAKLTEEYNNKVEFHHVLVKCRTHFLGEVQQLEQRGTVVDTSRESSSATMVVVMFPVLFSVLYSA